MKNLKDKNENLVRFYYVKRNTNRMKNLEIQL